MTKKKVNKRQKQKEKNQSVKYYNFSFDIY